jgi:hypothetical protein
MNPTQNTDKIECDCPFCPLVALDTNVCDLRVFLPKSKPPRVTLPDELIETIESITDEELRKKMLRFYKGTFTVISLFFRNTLMVREKGQSRSFGGHNYECTLEVIRPNFYKICFHTHRKEDNEEDPTE